MDQARAVSKIDGVSAIYSQKKPELAEGVKWYQLLPRIFRPKDELDMDISSDGVLVRNMDELAFAVSLAGGTEIISDTSLHALNPDALSFLKEQGVTADTLSFEMSRRDIEERGAEGSILVCYSRVPLMVTAQCMYRAGHSDKCVKTPDGHREALVDRKGRKIQAVSDCRYCYSVLYNPVPLLIEPDRAWLERTGISRIRLDMSVENPDETSDIVRSFVQGRVPQLREFT